MSPLGLLVLAGLLTARGAWP